MRRSLGQTLLAHCMHSRSGEVQECLRVNARKCLPKGTKLRYCRAFRIYGPPPPRQGAGDSPRRRAVKMRTKNRYFFYTCAFVKVAISIKFSIAEMMTFRHSRSPTSIFTFGVLDLRAAQRRALPRRPWFIRGGTRGGLMANYYYQPEPV